MTVKRYRQLSLLCLLLSLFAWIPNIVFQIASPFWLGTFILGIVGAVFAALGRHYFLLIGNIFMFFSFFIFMAIGYYLNA